MQKIIYLALALSLLQVNTAKSLDNEGLPASYGQSDIEQAKVPDSTKRQPQSYSGGGAPVAPKTGGTVTTTKPGNPPKSTQTTGIGTSSDTPSAPTVGSPSSSSNTAPFEVSNQEGTPVPSKTVNPASVNQVVLQDETITQNIKMRIATDPSVSSSTIIIMTQNGIVTLGGRVDTETQKQTIEEFARSMAGVKNVNSRITVEGTTGEAPIINTIDPSLTPPPPSP